MNLSASMTSVDPLRMDAAIEAVSPHVGSWHVDVMDGLFAPAFGFGPSMVTALVERRTHPVDVHLMIERPDLWAPKFAALGVRSVAFHVEARVDARAVARDIRNCGATPFIALRPETPIETAAPLFDVVDGCLLLTAPAGGGPFDACALQKLFAIPDHLLTTVDGRIGPTHFATLAVADVTEVVIGQALFGATDRNQEGARLSVQIANAALTRQERRRCASKWPSVAT